MVTTAHSALDAAVPLVNRDDERAILRDRVRKADAGEGQLILLGGEAGIGKTTLALLASSFAPGGARTLIGRSYDLMETPPYGLWHDCFRRWPEGVGIPPAPFHGQHDGPQTQEALFVRVQTAIAAIARTKMLILILDDLQWADPASLDLLRHLAHHLAEQRILIIGTYRNDELTDAHPLTPLLPRLMREAPTTRLLVPHLLPANVAEMVTAHFGAGRRMDALARSVFETTAGNPLFVREMCRALVSARAVRRTDEGWTVVATTLPSPPETLQELVAARIARLDDTTRRILEVAAIIGQTFTFPLLRRTLDLPEEAALAGLEQAAGARVIAEDDATREQYRFTHPIMHEVLYHAVLVTRRRQWHRRIGEAIEADTAPGNEAPYDRLAHHFGQAHDGARAVRYLVLAGDAAMRVFARASAIAYYEDALALAGAEPSEERDRLLLKLSGALAFADPVRRQHYAEEALRGFLARGDQFSAGQVRWRLASSYWRFGQYEKAEEECRLAMHALETAAGARATVTVGPLLLTALRDQGRYQEAIAQGEALLAIAEAGTDRGTLDAYHDLLHFTGYAHAALGHADDAFRLMQHGMDGQRTLDNPYVASAFLSYLFFVVGLPYFADRAELLADLVRQHGELAERGRAQVGASVAGGWYLAAYWAFLHGDWEGARREFRALPDPEPTSILARVAWTICAAQFALAEGRAADGIALIQRQLPPPGADWTLPHHLHIRALNLLAQLSLLDGQLVAAKQALDESAALLARSAFVPAVAEHHLAWAAFYRARGQTPRALTSATTARAQAEAHHDLFVLAAAHHMIGELAMERGAWHDAETDLRRAEEIVARIPAAHERAATALAHATLQAIRTDKPDRSAAERALAEADAIIAPLGAPSLIARLDALRTRLHAVNPAQAYGITAREADVLRHLVEGASNAEIADRLSISRRTVDQHVSSLLGKLGVTNRVAATSLAIERGLVNEAGSGER
ncbi:MAG: AAA family ATPase [Chloroflexota bacterium]|nr:AAA family ATPase [Chloroflexota bacterium]